MTTPAKVEAEAAGLLQRGHRMQRRASTSSIPQRRMPRPHVTVEQQAQEWRATFCGVAGPGARSPEHAVAFLANLIAERGGTPGTVWLAARLLEATPRVRGGRNGLTPRA